MKIETRVRAKAGEIPKACGGDEQRHWKRSGEEPKIAFFRRMITRHEGCRADAMKT